MGKKLRKAEICGKWSKDELILKTDGPNIIKSKEIKNEEKCKK